LRVISGTARGCRLKEPKGRDIRPTTDKVKESLFNIIQFDVGGSRVLDMFAGTGQLGIEALSRGAAEAVFIDASPAAAAIVRENVRLAGVEDRARVLRGDSLASVRGLGSFDLIFLDPPYSKGLLEKALSAINEFDILRENGIIICELPAEDPVPDAPGGCRRGREYRYGKIRLAVYNREERQ